MNVLLCIIGYLIGAIIGCLISAIIGFLVGIKFMSWLDKKISERW